MMKTKIKKFIKFMKRKDVQVVASKIVVMFVFMYEHPNFTENIKAFFGM